MLAALTLLGLAAASDRVLQARMASNLIEGSQAGQTADATLKWGEEWILGLDGLIGPTACSDACTAADVIRLEGSFGKNVEQQDLSWWEQNAHLAGEDPLTGGILNDLLTGQSTQSYWLIEEIHIEPVLTTENVASEIGYYRIVARSGAIENSMYIVTESIIARPWGDASLSDIFPKISDQPGFCSGVTGKTPCGRVAWRQLH